MDENLLKAMRLFSALDPDWKVNLDVTPSDDYSRISFWESVEDGQINGDVQLNCNHVSIHVWHYPSQGRSDRTRIIFEGEYQKNTEEYSLLKSFRDNLPAWQPVRTDLEAEKSLTAELRDKYLNREMLHDKHLPSYYPPDFPPTVPGCGIKIKSTILRMVSVILKIIAFCCLIYGAPASAIGVFALLIGVVKPSEMWVLYAALLPLGLGLVLMKIARVIGK